MLGLGGGKVDAEFALWEKNWEKIGKKLLGKINIGFFLAFADL